MKNQIRKSEILLKLQRANQSSMPIYIEQIMKRQKKKEKKSQIHAQTTANMVSVLDYLGKLRELRTCYVTIYAQVLRRQRLQVAADSSPAGRETVARLRSDCHPTTQPPVGDRCPSPRCPPPLSTQPATPPARCASP